MGYFMHEYILYSSPYIPCLQKQWNIYNKSTFPITYIFGSCSLCFNALRKYIFVVCWSPFFIQFYKLYEIAFFMVGNWKLLFIFGKCVILNHFLSLNISQDFANKERDTAIIFLKFLSNTAFTLGFYYRKLENKDHFSTI